MFSLPAVILNKYSHFDTPTGGRPDGRVFAKRDFKANSAELKLEPGLSLATSISTICYASFCFISV